MEVENVVFGRIPFNIDQKFIVETQPLFARDVADLCKEAEYVPQNHISLCRVTGTLQSHLDWANVYTERCVSSFFGLEKRIKEFCQAAQALDNARQLLGRPKMWTV